MKSNELKSSLLTCALLVIAMFSAMPAAALDSNVLNIGDNITAQIGNNINVSVHSHPGVHP